MAASLERLIASLRQQQSETAWRLRVLENNQRALNVHVSAIENSLIFRFLRSAGKPLLEWNARIEQLLRRFSSREAAGDPQYELWLQREQMAAEPVPGREETYLPGSSMMSTGHYGVGSRFDRAEPSTSRPLHDGRSRTIRSRPI